MLTMLDEHQVETAHEYPTDGGRCRPFTVKIHQQTFDIPFDYGFVCLRGCANRTGLDEIERWANANNVAKSRTSATAWMARRHFDGVREGRNVLD